MSEKPKVRRKPKATRRRDTDPVRVYDDGRIAYWTGGSPGAVGHPTGTIRQYRSDWNTHVPPAIGAVRCREVGISHYTAIFNRLNEERASEQVIDAVARTLGAVTVKLGVLNGYFPDGRPLGGPDLRRATVAGARATAARQTAAASSPAAGGRPAARG